MSKDADVSERKRHREDGEIQLARKRWKEIQEALEGEE